MLDLEVEFPDLETYQEQFNRCLATVRDAVADMEQIFKRLLKGQMYLDEEEVAKMLRCSVPQIPVRLQRYRIGRRYLYRLKDLNDYIESCRRRDRKEA